MITAASNMYQLAETRSNSRILHGMSNHPLYKFWKRMISRCYINSEKSQYRYYGGRGIRVAERWMDFRNFVNDMGAIFNPSLSLDRVDCNGHYTPDNCRWADKKTQAVNRRNTRLIIINGVEVPLCDAAKDKGLSPQTVAYRIKKGMDELSAVSTKAKSDPKPKSVIVNGKLYPSLTAAAKDIGVTKSAIFNRIKHHSAEYVNK